MKLDEDFTALCEQVAAIAATQERHTAQLAEHSKQLEGLHGRVGTVVATQLLHGKRLSQVNGQLIRMRDDAHVVGARLQVIEDQLAESAVRNDARLDALGARMNGTDQRLDRMDGKLDLILTKLDTASPS